MKTVGVVLDYYRFRNDIRDFIPALEKHFNVVAFVDKADAELLADSYDVRIIKPTRLSFLNRVLKILYFFFGNKPKSRGDSINWELRKLNQKIGIKQIVKIMGIFIAHWLPGILTFDRYIKLLQHEDNDLDGIDIFISFTDIKDEGLIAEIIESKKPLYSYVYSWDHAAKVTRFSHESVKYLVWNDEIRKDIVLQHKLNANKISVIGSTQLTYIRDYFPQISGTEGLNSDFTSSPYIYYASSWGREVMARQEIEFVKLLADKVGKLRPDMRVLFRPYPNLESSDVYLELKAMPNIVFDSYENDTGFVFTNASIIDKYKKIKNAVATFHAGSTFGMESCYFDVPNFFFTFKNFPLGQKKSSHLSLARSLKQYHLRKYLLLEGYDNVIDDINKLEALLKELFAGRDAFLEYNKRVSKFTPLYGMNEIALNVAQIISRDLSKQ